MSEHGVARELAGTCGKPPRPTLCLPLWALGGLLSSEAAVLHLAPEVHGVACIALIVVACCLLALPACRKRRPWAGVALALGLSVLLGMASAFLRLRLDAACAGRLAACPVSKLEFRITGDPSAVKRGFRSRASCSLEGRHLGDVWLQSAEEPELGGRLACVGRFRSNGDDSWGVSNRMQGILGTVTAKHLMRSEPDQGPLGLAMRLRAGAADAIDPARSAGRAVLCGSICGLRSEMRAQGIEDLFAACGVSHLVAVSGGHIAIVSSILSVLLGTSRLKPLARTILLIALSGLFVVFSGLAISAVRSWIMAAGALVGQASMRRGDALSCASLACLAMAALDPACVGQLSFQLSVLSVLALCLFSAYADYLLRALLHEILRPFRRGGPPLAGRLVQGMRQALAATLVCQAATLPLTISAFGRLSLVAPVANVLLALPFELLIGLGLAGACLSPLPLAGSGLTALAALVGDASVGLLAPLAHLPFASVAIESGPALPSLAVGSAAVLLLASWPDAHPKKLVASGSAAILVLILVWVRLRFFNPARVVVLDVGQGDAILIQDGAASLLVDAGPAGSLGPALTRQGVVHLDGVLLTHLHDDHYGGLEDLSGQLGAERVICGAGVAEAMDADVGGLVSAVSGQPPEELSYGDVIRTGRFALRMVSPQGLTDGSENADSVMLAGSFEGSDGALLTFLLTGDAEKDETGAAISRDDVGDVDFLKVGHHGSEVSLTSEEADVLDAEVAVASAGEGNSYGHPAKACQEVLREAGSAFLCTKDVGDVDIRPGREGPELRCRGIS